MPFAEWGHENGYRPRLRYDFPKIEAGLRAGQKIQITKRSKPLGRILLESKAVSAKSWLRQRDCERLWKRFLDD